MERDTVWRRALCTLLLLSVCTGAAGEKDGAAWDVVQTESGAVRGEVRAADYGDPYLSFRGIPYAQPPLGRLRFKSPRPAAAWSGVREARREGPACPQHDVLYGALMQPRGFSEDCLTLNVHVPLANTPGGFPVLVFIHGGGFGFGSGDADVYGPEYLVAKGVIVITFNYRLGALGFLNTESPELVRNAGLRDMVAALQWVQRNVAAFGGDPRAVTLGGQSAGASAAHLLALSPRARGLFHRVILMSGVAMRSWFSTNPVNARRISSILLSKLNMTDYNDTERARLLRDLPVQRIVEATREMQDTEGINVFVPVVEGPGPDSVVEEDPYAATVSGRLADVPMLIGHTDAECQTFARRFRELHFAELLKAYPVVAVPQSLLYESSETQNARHAADIARRYLSDNSSDPERLLQQFLRYCTDAYFAYPTLELAEAASRVASAPIFLYEFAHDGRYSPIKAVVSGGFRGAGHIEDMTYLLRTNSFPANVSENTGDEWTKEWMTILFSNFIKTGSPTPAWRGAADEVLSWRGYSAAEGVSLRLDRTPEPRRHVYSHLLPFFRSLHADTADPPADNRLVSQDQRD